MAVTENTLTVEDYVALVNRYMDRGATDGWPIPPSADMVAVMIQVAGRAPSEELGRYQLRENP